MGGGKVRDSAAGMNKKNGFLYAYSTIKDSRPIVSKCFWSF